MSSTFEITALNETVFSVCFKQTVPYNLKSIRQHLENLFFDLEEVTCSLNRINLFFKTPQNKFHIEQQLKSIDLKAQQNQSRSRVWEIPICFHPSFGEDLTPLFQKNSSKIEQYKAAFLATVFTLEFYGFLPGFGYLSGLDKSLHLERKATPSRQMAKGSVAVGGAHVGVYPQDSPGGWQCLGHSPVPWINFDQSPYVFIQPGDSVRFVKIDLAMHKKITLQVEMKVYQPKLTVYD